VHLLAVHTGRNLGHGTSLLSGWPRAMRARRCQVQGPGWSCNRMTRACGRAARPAGSFVRVRAGSATPNWSPGSPSDRLLMPTPIHLMPSALLTLAKLD